MNRFCTPKEKKHLAAHKSLHQFKAKQQILFEGSSVLGIHFIYSGKVMVFKTFADQSHQIMRLSQDGDILGHRGYGNDLQYPVSAAALEDSQICFFPNDVFFQTLKENPELTYQLMLFYAEELNHAEQRLFDFMRLPVKSRIARVLIQVSDNCSGKEILESFFPKRDLANMAVTTYETLLRTLSVLTKAKIISYSKKNMRILDRHELVKISEQG